MSKNPKNTIKIALTEEQQKKVREAIGKDVPSIELNAEELEERIAPTKILDAW
jgi:hypothetical protein